NNKETEGFHILQFCKDLDKKRVEFIHTEMNSYFNSVQIEDVVDQQYFENIKNETISSVNSIIKMNSETKNSFAYADYMKNKVFSIRTCEQYLVNLKKLSNYSIIESLQQSGIIEWLLLILRTGLHQSLDCTTQRISLKNYSKSE